jgi:pimeloyl-ACP methyl ester carboxylesterase
VRYTYAGGERIAWSAAGRGDPPIIHLAGWACHLTLDWCEGEIGRFNRGLARRHRLIRYDPPGLGLSAEASGDFDWQEQIAHIDAVLDAVGADRVAVFGKAASGMLGIAYAALRPERVTHLMLFDSAERVLQAPHFPHGVPLHLASAMEQLVLAEWGLGSKAIGGFMLPDATAEQRAWYSEYQRAAATPHAAAAMIRRMIETDVSEYLPRVKATTLVLHHRGDRLLALPCGVRLAERIPGARLVVLEGSASVPFFGDQEAVISAIESFL